MAATDAANWLVALKGWLLGGVAALVVLGLAMLLWGRLLHRALLVLIAAAIGVLLGAEFGPRIGLGPFVSELVAAITFGILGLVLARLLWAILAGLHVAAVVSTIVVVGFLGVQLAATQPAWQGDVIGQGKALADQIVHAVWAEHGVTVGATIILSGLAGLVVAFLLPRATVIYMTSLLGTGLLATAAGLVMMMWPATLAAASSGSGPYVMSGLSAGVLLVGIGVQSFGEIRARRRAADRDEEPQRKDTRRT